MSADLTTVRAEDPGLPDSLQLLAELSAALAAITGSSGEASFNTKDVRAPGACFVVARNASGQPVGCGALRPLQEGIAEIKRMYARPGTRGVGAAVLAHLESEALALGHRMLWLETRRVNRRAVAFYEGQGYARRPNYGRYVGNPDAVCFEKRLREAQAAKK